MQDWVEQSKERFREYQKIQQDAEDWEKYGRNPGHLYSGLPLEIAERWCDENRETQEDLPLNELESAFLKAGQEQREKEIAAKQAAEKKRMARLRRQVWGSAVFAFVMLYGAVTFYWQWQESNRQRAIAEARRLASASLYEQDKRFDLSLLLAAAATQEEAAKPMMEGYSALLSRLQSHPWLVSHLRKHIGSVNESAQQNPRSPDKQRIPDIFLLL